MIKYKYYEKRQKQPAYSEISPMWIYSEDENLVGISWHGK